MEPKTAARNGMNGKHETYELPVQASGQAWLRKARPEEADELQTLAQADGHEAVRPTHVFVRLSGDGSEEVIGCVSFASVPLVLPWFHTERCKARDSKFLIAVMENVMAEVMRPGQQFVCVPVAKGSPFEPVMDGLGYVSAGEFTLQFKRLRKD